MLPDHVRGQKCLSVLNNHTERRGEKTAVTEVIRGTRINMGIMWLTFRQSLLEGIFSDAHVWKNTKSDRNNCVTNERQLEEKAVQTLLTFSPLHSWPISVQSGCECGIVSFD